MPMLASSAKTSIHCLISKVLGYGIRQRDNALTVAINAKYQMQKITKLLIF